MHRGEGGGPGADDAPDVAAQHLEPGGVARLRPLVGGEPDVLARRRAGAVSSRSTRSRSRWSGTTTSAPRPAATAVAAATASAAGQSCSGGASRQGEPRGRRGLAGGDPAQQGLTGGVGDPGSGFRGGDRAGVRRARLVARARSAAAWRLGTASRSTSPRTPALRSATPGRAARISGVSTGSGLTTRRIGGEPTGVLGVRRAARRRTRPGRARRTGPAPGTPAGRRRPARPEPRTRRPGPGGAARCRRRRPRPAARRRGGRVAGSHARRSSRRRRRHPSRRRRSAADGRLEGLDLGRSAPR